MHGKDDHLKTNLIKFIFSAKNDNLSIKNCRASKICFGMRAESKFNTFDVMVLKIDYFKGHMIWPICRVITATRFISIDIIVAYIKPYYPAQCPVTWIPSKVK